MKCGNLRSKIEVILLSVCVSLLFTGCGQGGTAGETGRDAKAENTGESGLENASEENLISCEFTEAYMRIVEPYASSVVFSGKTSYAEVEGHTYQFVSDIAEEDCLAFVRAQEMICAVLEENGISTDGTTYCVLPDYTNWTDSDEATAYYGMTTMGSWEQVLTTIQVSLGDYTNYGYLYALANYVAGELGWVTDDIAVSTEISIDAFKEDPSLLNLVYPCFDLMYEDEGTIQICKVLALQTFDRLADPYAGEEAFSEEVKAWAQEQGIDFTPTYLQFAYYGAGCPLKIVTQCLEVFRTESYVADELYREGYITEDYFSRSGTIIPVLELLDEQLTAVCGIFDLYPADQIEVQMVGSISRSIQGSHEGGIYYQTSACICATTITTVAHEYTHHLYYLSCGCSDPAYESWYNEVVAYYYGTTLSGYEYLLLYNENLDSTYLTRTEEKLGEAYDEPADYIRLARINARMEEDPQYLFYLESETYGGFKIPFGEYFVRTYGEEAFLNSMLYPSCVEKYTGRTMDEILNDWCEDMADPEMDELVSYPDWFS